MTMLDRRPPGRFSRLIVRRRPEGGGAVACAAAMPLVVLALAVAADYASMSRFRTHVQLAADAASLAAAEAIARHPSRAGESDGKRPRRPGRRRRFRPPRSARRGRRADSGGEEPRRRRDRERRLCGRGAEQFRLRAWL